MSRSKMDNELPPTRSTGNPLSERSVLPPLAEFLLHSVFVSARALALDFESLALWLLLWRENLSTSATERESAADKPVLQPTRIRDLTEMTGIPRETVRRKLVGLQASGRIKRVSGGWVVDPAALSTLNDYTIRSAQLLCTAARLIEQAIDSDRQNGSGHAP